MMVCPPILPQVHKHITARGAGIMKKSGIGTKYYSQICIFVVLPNGVLGKGTCNHGGDDIMQIHHTTCSCTPLGRQIHPLCGMLSAFTNVNAITCFWLTSFGQPCFFYIRSVWKEGNGKDTSGYNRWHQHCWVMMYFYDAMPKAS